MRELRSYVVRIYRQGAYTLAGLVEDIRTGESRPFRNATELWNLMRKPASPGAPRNESADPGLSDGARPMNKQKNTPEEQ